MFKIAATLLLAVSLPLPGYAQELDLTQNIVDGCVENYDPDVDYFPVKYQKPTVSSFGDTDLFGEKFVPSNTTDLLEITYHKTYKIVYNKHNNASYLLYQCGTEPPQDEIDSGKHQMVVSIPHKDGVAITQTTQIAPMELLGLREEIKAYIGNPELVSSPCLNVRIEEETLHVVYDTNWTARPAVEEAFIAANPFLLIFRGPTDPVGPQVVNFAATQERTNVATFDWIGMYAAFYNLEGLSNQIAQETQARYDCASQNARMIVDQNLATSRRNLQDESESNDSDDDMSSKHPNDIKILWATYVTGYNWSVAQCDTWDQAYYCEYAAHCGTTVISRPPDMGYFQTFGSSPTKYWYVNDDELLELGKDADIWIFPSNRWDSVYALKNETMDQFRAVQNEQVYDNQGSGSNAWFEQRYAEYDVVGLDMCELVNAANPFTAPHTRRWFRNIFTEPIGDLPACNAPEELTEPYVPQGAECEALTVDDFSAAVSYSGNMISAVAAIMSLLYLIA
ncbi:MAG: hypothetical protein SGILL_003368 [Bacillariaceae sp.]